jgi:hypothetical protein
MIIVRFFVNLVILAIEVAAIAGVAWLGYRHPFILAGLAGVLAFGMGLWLERSRLKNELQFYFGRAASSLSWIGTSVALGEASFKALLAAVVTLVTFSGTDQARLLWVAALFGVCVFAGSSMLRRLSIAFGANPTRWGYFRLGAPLGLLYSAGITAAENIKVSGVALMPLPSLPELARRLVLEIPARPSLTQASELLFLLKQKFDEIVVSVLSHFLPLLWAHIAGIVVSVNMLTGFAIGVFAVAIAEIVRQLEEAGGGG